MWGAFYIDRGSMLLMVNVGVVHMCLHLFPKLNNVSLKKIKATCTVTQPSACNPNGWGITILAVLILTSYSYIVVCACTYIQNLVQPNCTWTPSISSISLLARLEIKTCFVFSIKNNKNKGHVQHHTLSLWAPNSARIRMIEDD